MVFFISCWCLCWSFRVNVGVRLRLMVLVFASVWHIGNSGRSCCLLVLVGIGVCWGGVLVHVGVCSRLLVLEGVGLCWCLQAFGVCWGW